jgi:hypothetical protein
MPRYTENDSVNGGWLNESVYTYLMWHNNSQINQNRFQKVKIYIYRSPIDFKKCKYLINVELKFFKNIRIKLFVLSMFGSCAHLDQMHLYDTVADSFSIDW